MTTELRVPAEIEIDRLIEPIIKWAQFKQDCELWFPLVVSVSCVPVMKRSSIVHPEILAVRLAGMLSAVRNVFDAPFIRSHRAHGILSLICQAAGGTLHLEDVVQPRRDCLMLMRNIVGGMHRLARPNIITSYSTDDTARFEKLHDVLPTITHHIAIE